MVHLYTIEKVHCKEKSEYISVYDCKVVTCEGLFTSIIMHPISTVLRDTSEISLQNIFLNTKSISFYNICYFESFFLSLILPFINS